MPEGDVFWKWNSTQNISFDYQTIVPVGSFAKNSCYNGSYKICSWHWLSVAAHIKLKFKTLVLACRAVTGTAHSHLQTTARPCALMRPLHKGALCPCGRSSALRWWNEPSTNSSVYSAAGWQPNFSDNTLTAHASTYLGLISPHCPNQLHCNVEHAFSCLFKRFALQSFDYIALLLLLSRLNSFIVSRFGQKCLQKSM